MSLLAKEIEKLQVISGMDAKSVQETVKQVVQPFLEAHNVKLDEVPEDDTRGLNMFA